MRKIKTILSTIGILAITSETLATFQGPLPPPPPSQTLRTSFTFLPPPPQQNVRIDPEGYFSTNPSAAKNLSENIKKDRAREKAAQNIVQEFNDDIAPVQNQYIVASPDTTVASFEESLNKYIQSKVDKEKQQIKYTEEFVQEISKQSQGKETLKKIYESYARILASTNNREQILFKLDKIKQEMKPEIESLIRKSGPNDSEIAIISKQGCLKGGKDFITQLPGNYAMAYITEYLFKEEGMKNRISSLSMEDEHNITLIYLYAFVRSEFIKRSSSSIPKFLRYKGILTTNHKKLGELLKKDLGIE